MTRLKEKAVQELTAQLVSLRPVLETQDDISFLSLFDEFVEHREFGLALHVVCDFILDTNSPQTDKSVLDQIQELHVVMEIEDDCVEKLKVQHSPKGAT